MTLAKLQKPTIFLHDIDFCAKVEKKKEIPGHQQAINYFRESGSREADDIEKAEFGKGKLELLLVNHCGIARVGLKDKCTQDWRDIQDLSNCGESYEHLKDLQCWLLNEQTASKLEIYSTTRLQLPHAQGFVWLSGDRRSQGLSRCCVLVHWTLPILLR